MGSHGVGKSTTAMELARSLNAKFIEVEAFNEELLTYLDVISRQTYFFATYVCIFLEAYSLARFSGVNVVLSNHPLNVIPYNYWWISDVKIADEVSHYMLKIIEKLPRIDILIYLYVSNVNKIKQRIVTRGRAIHEELNEEYILEVDKLLGRYVRNFGVNIADKVLIIDGCLEKYDRLKIILRELGVVNVEEIPRV